MGVILITAFVVFVVCAVVCFWQAAFGKYPDKD